jgi:succinylglutamate desuccinylase
LRGEVVFLAGNLAALDARVRFIDVDLNRQWRAERVAAVRSEPRGRHEPAEIEEQRELIEELERVAAAARGSIYFLDLHTSSAAGPPFLTVGDTLRNRRFARAFPLPLILGLEEQVDGALLEWLNNRGFVTLGVEAGRHDSPQSVACHEAVLWVAMVAAGLLPSKAVPELDRHRERLVEASRGYPRVVEVRRRHAITAEDGFRMERGFTNFTPIAVGQHLARDLHGPVLAPERGLLLLPLYQGLGDDGFFLARRVRPFWLVVSAVLRRLRLNTLMPLLPGVRRHADAPDVLVVDTRIARFYPLEIFHLFGFRKVRQVGQELVVSRRRYDLSPPQKIAFG